MQRNLILQTKDAIHKNKNSLTHHVGHQGISISIK